MMAPWSSKMLKLVALRLGGALPPPMPGVLHDISITHHNACVWYLVGKAWRVDCTSPWRDALILTSAARPFSSITTLCVMGGCGAVQCGTGRLAARLVCGSWWRGALGTRGASAAGWSCWPSAAVTHIIRQHMRHRADARNAGLVCLVRLCTAPAVLLRRCHGLWCVRTTMLAAHHYNVEAGVLDANPLVHKELEHIARVCAAVGLPRAQ